MRLATELGYGLNAFRGRGTMTPFLGMRRGVGERDLRFGVEATRSGSAPLAAAGDFASVDPNQPAAHGRIVAVRADSPGSTTPVRLVTVENGWSVPRTADPGRPGIAVTRADETMLRAVAVFVGCAV